MDLDTNFNAILERHTVHLSDTPSTKVSFYSYYTNQSPIYYELDPIIKIFKFTDEKANIDSIPIAWVKPVSAFDDNVFNNSTNKLDSNALFVEAAGIAHLIGRCTNKSIVNTISSLYNMCFRRTESDRVTRLHKTITDLRQATHSLQDKFGSISTSHSFIEDAIKALTSQHGIIHELLMKLLEKL